MKVIKLYAWEKVFLDKITAVRELELMTLRKIGYLSAAQSFTWSCTPFLVSFSSFAIYSFINPEPLTSTKVFVCIALFNLLQFPLTVFPNVISSFIEASVSFSRLYKFLNSEEIDVDAVERPLLPPFLSKKAKIERVIVENGTFGWNSDPTISNISFKVADGTLMAIVGNVGCGKSTLLSAILGDTYKLNGHVLVRGCVAYVPQNAWIMNATLRNNVCLSLTQILFGKPYNETQYNATIDACGLKPDFDMLPSGDLTEIGERGINLSGGQKVH